MSSFEIKNFFVATTAMVRFDAFAIATLTVLLTTAQIQPAHSCPPNSRCAPAPPEGIQKPKPTIPAADLQVIPGERVGAVTPTTTRQDLARIYGASRLTDRTIYGAEGIGTFAATRVNLPQGRSFMVVWRDSTRTKPLDVRNFGTAWKTPQGIGVGSSLAQLRQQLGEFQLLGLAWDYGGTVLLQQTKLAPYQGKLILRVDAAANAAQKYPTDYQAVSGDGTFASTNPHWQPLGIRVTQMIVVLNPE